MTKWMTQILGSFPTCSLASNRKEDEKTAQVLNASHLEACRILLILHVQRFTPARYFLEVFLFYKVLPS